MRLKGIVQKQAELVLAKKHIAMLYSMVFVCIPYTAWLSMTILGLVTMRKGYEQGLFLLVPVLMAYVGLSTFSYGIFSALINGLIIFVPCYLVACTLRASQSWVAVAAVLFLMLMFASLLVQSVVPDWVISQYVSIKALLKDAQANPLFSEWLNDPTKLSDVMIANYAFGIQMASIAFSAISSLMMARALQSRLFCPGEFIKELLSFRGNRLSLLLLIILLVAASKFNVVAMNALPLLFLFFMLAGLSFSAAALLRKRSTVLILLMLIPLLIKPLIMMPIYLLIGLLDSMFNLRVHFAEHK